ncbi:Ankyrin repeat-containing domain [Phytophthora cactorum]|nr:Ankyrin repeat-containing domain [Phytophthora cactorum]
MQYIAARAPADTLDPFFRRWMLNATSWFIAIQGDLPALQWLVEIYLLDERLSAAVYAAAANGHVEIIEWLHKFHRERIYWNCIEMCGALDYGHDDVVQWLMKHSPPRPECLKLVMRSAAKTGNTAAVRWLYNECHAPAENALVHAQKEGHWETARWILVNCDLAVRRVQWDGAAACGALSFLKYAYSRDLGEPRSSTLLAAASNEGCTKLAMDYAASYGHLEVLKWLHANRTEGCTPAAMDWAASYGHLDVVQWLHSNRSEGCTAVAMTAAAMRGHLGVVRWLHCNRTEGCLEDTLSKVVATGNIEVVKWIYENRSEVDSRSAMKEAIIHDRFEIVVYLHSKDVEIGDFADTTLYGPSWELTQWLVKNYAEGISGCSFEIPTWDYRFNDWCRQASMRRINHDEVVTLWLYD